MHLVYAKCGEIHGNTDKLNSDVGRLKLNTNVGRLKLDSNIGKFKLNSNIGKLKLYCNTVSSRATW